MKLLRRLRHLLLFPKLLLLFPRIDSIALLQYLPRLVVENWSTSLDAPLTHYHKSTPYDDNNSLFLGLLLLLLALRRGGFLLLILALVRFPLLLLFALGRLRLLLLLLFFLFLLLLLLLYRLLLLVAALGLLLFLLLNLDITVGVVRLGSGSQRGAVTASLVIHLRLGRSLTLPARSCQAAPLQLPQTRLNGGAGLDTDGGHAGVP
mmetsp:Transcript_30189/g.50820  ORF Transcript_30189/g.50820 Transcript_30189/m.50820 type:complete len:206 (-) Transcript_30189:1356-1973(-)